MRSTATAESRLSTPATSATVSQRPVHDRGRDGLGEAGDPGEPEHDLQQPGADRDQAGHRPAEAGDEFGDDRGGPGRGPADLQRRPTQ
jgi:hypothetical protein